MQSHKEENRAICVHLCSSVVKGMTRIWYNLRRNPDLEKAIDRRRASSMQSLWNEQEAADFPGTLGPRVYTSRLLGREAMLVLHGGGNTSVKVKEPDLFGEEEDILYVKGSGWNLATIDARGFTPMRLKPLVRLTTLETMTDEQWLNELKSNVTNVNAPNPSVEALMHAILPFPYVDHAHPDALLAIGSTPGGVERLKEIYGDTVVIVPYTRSGFPIAKLCAERFAAEAGEQTVGMILMNHGLFTFGETAKISYERMIDLTTRAERYLQQHGAWQLSFVETTAPDRPMRHELAALRKEASDIAGFPLIVTTQSDPQCLSFARREDVAQISQQGPATPDHVIRTKNRPLLGIQNLQAFRESYERYFNTYAPKADRPLTMLDPVPRVILDPDYGMITTGRTAKDTRIASDIYRQTMEIILRATALEEYQALSEQDIFNVEYWSLEQAKLGLQQQQPVFTGEIALVTGAASGIGKACVESFLERGAAVVGLDINPAITELFDREDYLGIKCDVTSDEQIVAAMETTAKMFGGLDMLVLNAGIFPGGCRIDALKTDEWRKVMHVNLDANLIIMREAYPLLQQSPRKGRVAIIGSKNVPAPGPGAAAYSASKAALNQLARVAALEWGKEGIRINSVHPHAVFDTGLWTDEVLRSRAEHYGLTVEQYKKNNLMKVEIRSRHVAELAAEMCGPLFESITGAQVPIDGGSDRVI
jgi:rhamnose utilization protein RhaD (predicted bifunctional aldolase and dehydrogenase)/NAD(P)-dependent dehydrogenase (short-subunit alcohol dehydrogenase family)